MSYANIPMKSVGPLKLVGDVDAEVLVPLATYETPLWPSVGRGAKLSRLCGGIQVSLLDERMTRSVLFEADSARTLHQISHAILADMDVLYSVVSESSRFAKLLAAKPRIVGRMLYLRFEFQTGDASGHNMVTKASDYLMEYLLKRYDALRYVSISGNYCIDKKASSVNNILGRGKHVVAEMYIPREICESHLRTTPEALADINTKKNLVGSIVAGSLHSANAHYANMLLAFYLATGQDAANIVEGSQGITYVEAQADSVYFSVSLPNIIVGTVGNGKGLDFVRENLALLGCTQSREPGENANRLAMIAAATVFCSELSLLAAQTNPGELMKSHVAMERGENKA
ncbi:MAG: hydroxymethylglutaryl-CoA reductase [Gammaproteobacteria bacterium CG11_big_fil_rev_8_21_14_0_20_46_22]|nr:MAG: hydroxymethylglutaryl-CoA reductase [Gammaproteobacteria bacterium CG12_big_fil_rev_8_21_14_0_65_46_12]PIR11120.1 MAG: hydroxymethylglutaryl-CoA reductase [Gammaproteobacteria bacterium CG11_big_fil_rev_8_21_14_0_20_46_22]